MIIDGYNSQSTETNESWVIANKRPVLFSRTWKYLVKCRQLERRSEATVRLYTNKYWIYLVSRFDFELTTRANCCWQNTKRLFTFKAIPGQQLTQNIERRSTGDYTLRPLTLLATINELKQIEKTVKSAWCVRATVWNSIREVEFVAEKSIFKHFKYCRLIDSDEH